MSINVCLLSFIIWSMYSLSFFCLHSGIFQLFLVVNIVHHLVIHKYDSFSFEILRECPPWGKPLLIVWQRWYSTLWKVIYHLFRWLDIYLSNHLSIKESLTYDTVVNYVYCSIFDLWPYNHLSIHLFLTNILSK